MKMKVLLLGAPGSGKGTQAKYLASEMGYKHISMGDLLRAEVEQKTALGLEAKSFMDQGALVPDSVVNNMVVKKLGSLSNVPYLLDGFPRTIPQAAFIGQNGVKFDKVIYFGIRLETVLDRMSGRLTCKACGASFHAKYNQPKEAMVCDLCHATLVIRDDDKPETVKRRFETYLESTEPLLDYYKGQNIVAQIDAEQPIEMIQSQVKAQLE